MGIDGLFPLLEARCKATSLKPPSAKFQYQVKDLTGTWHRACLPAKTRPAWCYTWPIKRVPWPTAGSQSNVTRLVQDPLATLESLPSGCPADPAEYDQYKTFQVTIEQKQLIEPEDEYSRFPPGFFPIEFFHAVWRFIEEAAENAHVVLVSDNSRIECKIKQEERARRVASSHKKTRVTQVPDYRQVTRLFDMEMVEDDKFLRHALLDPEGVQRCRHMRSLLFGYLNDCFRQAALPKGIRLTTILEGQEIHEFVPGRPAVVRFRDPTTEMHAEADTYMAQWVNRIGQSIFDPEEPVNVRVDSIDSDLAVLLSYVACQFPRLSVYQFRGPEYGWVDIGQIRAWLNQHRIKPEAFVTACGLMGCDFLDKNAYTFGLGQGFLLDALETYWDVLDRFDATKKEWVEKLIATAACVKYGVSPRSIDSLADLDSQLRAIKKRPIACVSNRGLSAEAWTAFEAFYKYWLQDSGLSSSEKQIKK